MVALLCLVLVILAAPFKSKSRLEAENTALRHQLIVLRRKLRGRVRLTNSDRWFFIQLYRWFPSVLNAITIIDLTWLSWTKLCEKVSLERSLSCRGRGSVRSRL